MCDVQIRNLGAAVPRTDISAAQGESLAEWVVCNPIWGDGEDKIPKIGNPVPENRELHSRFSESEGERREPNAACAT